MLLPILVHVQVQSSDYSVTPRQPVVVENGVCLGHEVVGQRLIRRQSVTAIGVDRFQPQVARQPTVARRFAYAAQRARDHRSQSRRSRPRASVMSRWLDFRGFAASRRRVQEPRHDTEPDPPHGDHWPSRKFGRMSVHSALYRERWNASSI